jgi:hypothetical protein
LPAVPAELWLSCRRYIATDAPPNRPATHALAVTLGKVGGAVLHKASKQYLTATVTGLVVAILFPLTAIIVRSIAASEMDGKISADATHLKRLP